MNATIMSFLCLNVMMASADKSGIPIYSSFNQDHEN